MNNWFKKGKSVPNMWKCLDWGRVGREIFVWIVNHPPSQKTGSEFLAITKLDSKSLGAMVQHSETPFFSLNCLKFNLFIKFLKFWECILHNVTSYHAGKKKKKKGQNKLYCHYFVVVKASIECYQLFVSICIIVVILVFSGCYSIFIWCHIGEIYKIASWWHWCVNYTGCY